MKRVFIIVPDSMGVGEAPDAYKWHDEGSNTLGAIRKSPKFNCPNLKKLGLFNIEGVGGGVDAPLAEAVLSGSMICDSPPTFVALSKRHIPTQEPSAYVTRTSGALHTLRSDMPIVILLII